MLRIQQVTRDPRQKQTLILPDGKRVVIRIEYKPNQQGWFFNEISTEEITIKGMRIVTSPNILRQFYKLISFGIACETDGGQDPLLDQDFESGRSRLFLLSSEEVQAFEDYLSE